MHDDHVGRLRLRLISEVRAGCSPRTRRELAERRFCELVRTKYSRDSVESIRGSVARERIENCFRIRRLNVSIDAVFANSGSVADRLVRTIAFQLRGMTFFFLNATDIIANACEMVIAYDER